MNDHDKSSHELELIFRLGLAIEHLNQALETKVGVSTAQWAVLNSLRECPAISALVLAKRAGVHPSTLTQGLKRLESKGYLVMATDPLDKRKKILSLTRKGKEMLDEASKELRSLLDRQKLCIRPLLEDILDQFRALNRTFSS